MIIITDVYKMILVLGGEVAMYCSHHFIDLLKETEEYKEGRIMDALKRTFMEIDKNLRDSYVVKVMYSTRNLRVIKVELFCTSTTMTLIVCC